MNGERLCFSDPPEEAVTKGSPGGFLRLMLLSGGCGGGLRMPGAPETLVDPSSSKGDVKKKRNK